MYTDALARIFAGLRSRDPKLRNEAAHELQQFFIGCNAELSAESVTKLQSEVMRRLFELINSNYPHEKLDILLDIQVEKQRLYRFYNYLKPALPCSDMNVMIAASQCLGHIARVGGAYLGEQFIDFEAPRALELLTGDRSEGGRYAAVLIIKELAQNSPALFNTFVTRAIERIWIALRDPKVTIREAASDALSACLVILERRKAQNRNDMQYSIYAKAEAGLKINTVDTIHASLLVYRDLLLHAGMFLKPRFGDVCDLILRYKDHRDFLIRKTVILLIPTLATYDPQAFTQTKLRLSMGHLMSAIRKERERTVAYNAVGHVASAVGSAMKDYMDSAMFTIDEQLRQRSKKGYIIPEDAILQCLGKLAAAIGPSLAKHVHELLGEIFSTELSESLVNALRDIAKYIPPLLKTIQDRLLNMLSLILSDKSYRALGAPNPSSSQTAAARELSKVQASEAKKPEVIQLALQTLGSFDFSGHILNEFVRDTALPFVDDDNAEIRKAAALTCSITFIHDPVTYQTSTHAIEIIGDMLDKLMTLAIADPEYDIRLSVLQSLDEKFDRHLAQAENVRSLFIALNDEVFAVREVAIKIIGRLSCHNPAYVMPSLRKALIQLLTELEYSTVRRNKEESARLLGLLVSASQRLIKPYANPMMKVLLPKASDNSSTVSSNVLCCIGELAQVGGEELMSHVDIIMPLLIETLHDQSSLLRRDAALRTLGQVVSNTGYVIEPYLRYPGLLDALVKILQTDQTPSTRTETVRVMGLLGALDPYKHKDIEKPVSDVTTESVTIYPADVVTPSNQNTSDDFYQTVAFNALVNMLKDPSLSNHHHAVIEAIMNIFKTQGLKCVSYLPQIVPAFMGVIRSCAPSLQEFYFQQLAILVSIVKHHIRNFLTDILELIREFWNPNSTLQITIISLIEILAKALEGEFRVHLPVLLPPMLQTFDFELADKRQPTLIRILRAFSVFGSNVEEYLHLVVPAIVKTIERPESTVQLRKAAIITIGQLSRQVNFCDHASRIIHPLARVLSSGPAELRNAAMDILAALVLQLGPDFAVFVPMISKVLLKHRIQHGPYNQFVNMLLNGERLPQDYSIFDSFAAEKTDDQPPVENTKLIANQQHLKKAYGIENVELIQNREDWTDWLRRLGIEFLKESPSHALRACRGLAEAHPPLLRELFNAAFVSCWTDLYDQYQDELGKAMERALTSPSAPPDVVHTLLNLAEFMEHDDKPLPIDIPLLGEYAMNVHAYAKALHYQELEFLTEATPTVIESLVHVNTKLQQQDAAWGTLKYAREQLDIVHHEEWYEKLGRWHEALVAYAEKAEIEGDSPEVTLGRMKCLHALGEWEQLSDFVQNKWVNAGHEERRAMAPLAAAAAWSLNNWEMMDNYITVMKQESPDRFFYRAILSVHDSHYQKALHHITKARESLDSELTSLVTESYGRAYNVVVRVQMLAELEEIIQYKLFADQPDRQSTIRKTWMKRLKGAQPDVEVWQRILQVRTLVLSPAEDTQMWIKFANLCRKSDRMFLAEKVINSLLGPDPSVYSNSTTQKAPPQVIYAHLKFTWAKGAQDESLNWLRDFTASLSNDLGLNPTESSRAIANEYYKQGKITEYKNLLARCYFKQGQWQVALQEDWFINDADDILGAFYQATQLDPSWYKAWHTFALANFEVIAHLENASEEVEPETLVTHIVPAVQAFFKSIALSGGNSLQDTLRLLTLWFQFGYHEDVSSTLSQGFTTISVDTWLEVIPQIIARIHAPNLNVRRLIHQLLCAVGRAHPQALIYPLTVASKSQSQTRKAAALAIMDRMREHSPKLVEQAGLVSNELIRVAILWNEMWHEGLEEASRHYFVHHNPAAMIETLKPLHDLLDRGPETLRETSFVQAFSKELIEARDYCRKWKHTKHAADLNQAWDLYYPVFRKIEKQVTALTAIELQYVAPRLLNAKDLDLAVPGTYQSGKPVIRIAAVVPRLSVLTTKQRPRKMEIRGSDGKEYMYLLKGHEDLRQDERAMQLFGLINLLLSVNPESFKRHLSIHRFSVIPISPNSGLLGWVQNTDTMHMLIRDYRETRKILLNIEHRLMLQMAPDFDHLCHLNKLEVFEYALDNTTGQDLYRILWLKSRNSEAWLERRTNYTRSLAVMSMVGYILGLGDRHPSNLLIDRITGGVIHIDFGDSFEVAQHRDKYPERMPFRLTRMLVLAMEVCGVEGSFKRTCDIVMSVLRNNRDSLMAVLAAFVHDPLINWRLDAENIDPSSAKNRRSVADERNLVENGVRDETIGNDRRPEPVNRRALAVMRRVEAKLSGRDFKPTETLTVGEQVDKLILQATSLEVLCMAFVGWCAFW
ncbi:hypothetical protein E3P89_00930 [Wallemia ichthyophaga]|uniref:Serine/threonine-protein kinase TOR n=1 Tax=Wallemia ichthyophaga TaxID=245174 RepID=A0A4T0HKJ1_WALIC|nr:hypothetical protein E3P90_01225 [Wallemia ichthyophaga]TIB16590.1 hypothetical protein E3P93_00976 [Wallemia ichthyophaga]TIB24595.1 hypothetical protein E3P89_00930 [Wallemia ichthyophaga]TIB26474.1 hypothetical protein E3P88_01094 [Wallemia ichthyophaga]